MNEIEIKTGIISYYGQIEDGIAFYVSLTINKEYTFDGLYWFNHNHNSLSVEEDFLDLFGITDITKLSFYSELLLDIDSLIINKEKLLSELNSSSGLSTLIT